MSQILLLLLKLQLYPRAAVTLIPDPWHQMRACETWFGAWASEWVAGIDMK